MKAVFISALNHLTTESDVGSFKPNTEPSDSSQVLLAGVPGDFSCGSPVLDQPPDWPVSITP